MRMDTAMRFDFEACSDVVRRICRPYRLATSRWREFRGNVCNFTTAGLNITSLHLGSSRMIQDPAAATGTGSRYYSLLFQARGAARITHARGSIALQAGELALLHSGSPLVTEVAEGSVQHSLNFLRFEDTERLDHMRTDGCLVVRSMTGPGALLVDSLLCIARNQHALGALDLRDHMRDLLLAALGRTELAVSPSRRDTRLVGIEGMIEYIDSEIHRPTLCPNDVAVRFGVSLRQLYRISTTAGRTPAALIRERRLRLARHLLSSEARPLVTRVAYACGFKDSGHFSRAYRQAFGEPPSRTGSACNTGKE